MKLGALLSGCDVRVAPSATALDCEIRGIAYDSRRVGPGDLFVAIRGLKTDGNQFIAAALRRGAAAVVSSSEPLGSTPWIQVGDDRAALAALAANFYGHPSRELRLIGITGTNGKTTTTFLAESILKAAGHNCAMLGTIAHRGPGFSAEAARTTPESPDVQRMLRQTVDSGWSHAVMEVSSHAIALQRTAGLHFDIAAFTNLTRDHLDYHGDMDRYFAAKRRLFEGLDGQPPRKFILNQDDERFESLRSIAPERVVSYGVNSIAAVRPQRFEFGWSGTEAIYQTPIGELTVHTALTGTPNLYNLGAAIGIGLGLGIALDVIREGIESLSGVPGRFELIQEGQPYRVVVDYAHTDDALDRLLRTAREITARRVIVVFGCGGDRDRTKRPVMGEIAGLRSDFVVVTSDNPRSEDPKAIIEEIETGLKRTPAPYAVFVDRRDAIRAAIQTARPGDTVVLAGKGHETYQVIGTDELPFDDRAVARELIHEAESGRSA